MLGLDGIGQVLALLLQLGHSLLRRFVEYAHFDGLDEICQGLLDATPLRLQRIQIARIRVGLLVVRHCIDG